MKWQKQVGDRLLVEIEQIIKGLTHDEFKVLQSHRACNITGCWGYSR